MNGTPGEQYLASSSSNSEHNLTFSNKPSVQVEVLGAGAVVSTPATSAETGEQAFSMKLIDQVGDFQAAVNDTAKSVGIKGEPTLVHPEKDRKTLLDLMTGDISQYIPTREKLMEQQVGFYYLWK